MNMYNLGQEIADAQPIKAEAWQSALIESLVDAAFRHSGASNESLGLCLAAAFDLAVASQYYSEHKPTGWLYCDQPTPINLYPFTNACPRCALSEKFSYQKANKPESGNIGKTTSTFLCLIIAAVMQKTGRSNTKVAVASEPVDVVVWDNLEKWCFLAEIKASPLVIFPLAADQSTRALRDHQSGEFRPGSRDVLSILLPTGGHTKLVNIGRKSSKKDWAAKAIADLCRAGGLFAEYFDAWKLAYRKYSGLEPKNGSYWLTNACGAPVPSPTDWPRRKSGSGIETISDNKTSVGMDRTDDIKKATYQVLKIASMAKVSPRDGWDVYVGILSNIHAVQHYHDYLESLHDIMWFKANDDSGVVEEAPPATEIYNLFDGIVTFTSSSVRANQLKAAFAPFIS